MPRKTKITFRNGTNAEWIAANPSGANNLQAGEVGFENDSGSLKVGDGTRLFNGTGGDYQTVLPYVNQYGNSSTLGSLSTTIYPDNYADIGTNTVNTLSHLTTYRIMYLMPFEIKDINYYSTASINCLGALVGSYSCAVYSSDDNGRPYKLLTDPIPTGVSITATSGINTDSFSWIGGTAPTKETSLYWVAVAIYDVTTTGVFTGYNGNDTYVHPTAASVTTTALGSGNHYGSYAVQMPYMSGSITYGTGSKTLTYVSATGTSQSLTGVSGSNYGLVVGDAVTIYTYADANIYMQGTVTTLNTSSIVVNVTTASTTGANSKNILVKTSDFNYAGGAGAIYSIIFPATLTPSMLIPYCNSAGTANSYSPLVRLY